MMEKEEVMCHREACRKSKSRQNFTSLIWRDLRDLNELEPLVN
jgi:hypothetical protein